MKSSQDRIHNYARPASFPWELAGAFPLTILAGLFAMEVPARFHYSAGMAVAGTAFVGFMGLLLLNAFSSCRYQTSDAAIVIHRPLRPLHIFYASILQVDRVRREARGSTGGVWITFRRGRHTQRLKLMPECPEALVWDILEHCPHLTGIKSLKLVSDRSFNLAKKRILERGPGTDVW